MPFLSLPSAVPRGRSVMGLHGMKAPQRPSSHFQRERTVRFGSRNGRELAPVGAGAWTNKALTDIETHWSSWLCEAGPRFGSSLCHPPRHGLHHLRPTVTVLVYMHYSATKTINNGIVSLPTAAVPTIQAL